MAFVRAFTVLSLALSALAYPKELQTRSVNKTIPFTINLTWGEWSPIGGIAREAILSNGTIPGPPLHMKVGDTVEFLVNNFLPNETAVHFHGITQLGTPYSDGVPGISQKPIAAGASFLYKWTADESGTYFYHAHYRAQIQDGLYGAIVIAPADGAETPFGLISNDSTAVSQMAAADEALTPVFISDYTHYTSQEVYAIEKATNLDWACADAILVGGLGSQYCLDTETLASITLPPQLGLLASQNFTALTAKGCLPPNLLATQGNFTQDLPDLPADVYYDCAASTGEMFNVTVDPSKGWAAMTFISSSGWSLLKYTIDGHKMWVYAVDGQYVNPFLVDEVEVDNGQRYSVLVELNQTPATYTIRVANDGLNQIISGYGALVYLGSTAAASSDLAVIAYNGVNTSAIVPYVSDVMAIPYPPGAWVPAATADVTFSMEIAKIDHAWQWTLSGSESFNQTEEDTTPYLFQEPSAIPSSDLILRTYMGQWVDLIIKTAGPLAQPHPMHKHSNKAYVLGQGTGAFNYSTVAEAAADLPAGSFNFENPPYRDGYTTTPAEGNSSWLALRYQVINPGAFILHCHIQTHFSGGMAVAILDGVDQWPTVPAAYLNGTGIGSTLTPTKKVRQTS